MVAGNIQEQMAEWRDPVYVGKWPQALPTRPGAKRAGQDREAGRFPREIKPEGEKKPGELTPAQEREVSDLKARDREVRAHEQAHQAAGGELVQGGARYEMTTGPDGKQYAAGGEVQIDTRPVEGDPAATARRAERIRQAALAPANPSAQDYRVAATAAQMAARARGEMARQAYQAATAEGLPDARSLSTLRLVV